MKKESRKKLNGIIQDDLNNYEKLGLNDADKSNAFAIIAKELSMVLADEKQEEEVKKSRTQFKADDKKFEFEKEKFEFECKVKLEALAIEKMKVMQDFEIKKLQIQNEQSRLKIENENAAQRLSFDYKNTKNQLYVSITGLATTLFLGLFSKGMFATLAHNAQKHEYNDYQLEPSSSKENRNNLLK